MSPLIASKALKLINNLHKDTAIVNPEDSDLSTRELEILRFISTGLNYNEIAEKLFISPKNRA